MKFIRLEPPGSLCLYSTLFEVLKSIDGQYFLEVGCGNGEVSKRLLKYGYHGVGVDFSSLAIQKAKQNLQCPIKNGRYTLLEGDLFDNPPIPNNFDFVLSLFVIEHIRDDIGYLKLLKARVRRGGYVILSVPARKDKWSFEDETVGHLRRYDRKDLFTLFKAAGLKTFEFYLLLYQYRISCTGLAI